MSIFEDMIWFAEKPIYKRVLIAIFCIPPALVWLWLHMVYAAFTDKEF